MKTANHIRAFIILTFLISWLVWGGMLIFPPSEKWYIPLLFLGAFGPTLAAIFIIQTRESTAVKKDFWKRVIDFRRIGWKWLLFILLVFPVILAIGYSFLYFLGSEMPDFASYFSGLDSFEAIGFFLVFMLLGGPLAEELGWRGYILDPLLEKWGKFKGSLILGLIWAIWHLPLFFIEGSSQHQKGFGVAGWSWGFQIIVLSVIFTWMYQNTRRSIFAAVLLHFMANFAYPLNLDGRGELVFSLVRLVVILPILISWYRESMAANKEIPTAVNPL